MAFWEDGEAGDSLWLLESATSPSVPIASSRLCRVPARLTFANREPTSAILDEGVAVVAITGGGGVGSAPVMLVSMRIAAK